MENRRGRHAAWDVSSHGGSAKTELAERAAALRAELARVLEAFDRCSDEDVSGTVPTTRTIRTLPSRRPEPTDREHEHYRYVLDAMSDGVVMVDADARITFANARYASILGYTRQELVGRSAFDLILDEDMDEGRARLGRRRTGIAEVHEQRLRHKSGDPVWVLARAVPLMSESGAYEGALGLVTNVTEAREMGAVRSRLEAVVDGTDDAIVTCDAFGRITSWNHAAEHMYGYADHEMLGQPISVLVPEDRRGEDVRILERVGSNLGLRHHETQHRREDGSGLDVSLTVTPLWDGERGVVGATLIARDLSERRHASERMRATEKLLRQSQKMDAVGRLASGIAHDFNNLLSVVMSSTGFLLDDVPPESPLRGDIEEIQAVSRRAAELTKQLLAFSRQQLLEPQVVDVNGIAVGLERLLSRTLGEHVELELDLSPRLGRVFADAGQLEQVILNLVVNARDAMPSGGVVLLETRNMHIDTSVLSVQGPVPPGEYIALAVTDTGCGMSAETAAHVFEPFFSTKELGNGTGLGLATVFGIVTQSNGYISLESEPHIGTCVRVLLPRSDRHTAIVSIPPPPIASLRGTETVLLVEDDDLVRRAMRASLTRRGYRVLEAQNGGEALLIAEQHAGVIELLIADVVMPRMSGTTLAARVVAMRPDIRVLYVSGHTGDAIAEFTGAASARYLQKPFGGDFLLRKVREVIEAPALH